ncbi:threonine/homoserine/homoserine lactone efflux protein [Mesorhizobium soli]|uniref:LysE family translocator n=1 Tax=Pseudaminobacter soli (ex Li et al. 2025) TaxID=1295366 RepID=UPI00247356FE|nr:LysE family translocator [Mesorhizobium soli]MDH6229446.1 threonine/homoserine/homoserine lactone efflux protein [Mesorhizobium soli]
MTLFSLLAYAGAVFAAAASPGPSMLAVITTGVSRGAAPAIALGIGIGLGDLVLVGLALMGLAAVAHTVEWIFLLLKYAGAAYLIWLGFKMWRSSPQPLDSAERPQAKPARSVALGAAVGLGNPKAILFHASIMPLILDVKALTVLDGLVVLGVVFCINVGIMTFYSLAAGRSARWFNTSGRMRWMNRVAGSAMIGTGALIASR